VTEVVSDPDRPWEICVNLVVDKDGNILSTANDVMNAINKHPIASQLVTADLANYHEGGNGIVRGMERQMLSVAPPYEVDGKTVITPLGYATKNVSFNYSAPAQKDPNIIFQALEQGPDGNDIGIRYTTSADPSYYASASLADEGYQDFTSVRYEKVIDANGVEKDVMVVHLATSAIPSCPDEKENPEASAKWKELYPVYSCTSSRAVLSTAGSVVEALLKKNLEEPDNALVWASMERYPQGNSAKVGVTEGTVWLEGGNCEDDAAEHGVNLKFLPDGTAMQVGDIFEVPVGWYRGDGENIDINAGNGFRNTMNVTGNEIFGDNAASDNIFDTIQRLVFALNNNDSEAVGRELPAIKAAIEKVTTMETAIGTRLIRNEFITSNLETSKYNSEALLSTTEDAAFEELITNLKNAQTVYEAVLGATGLTNKLSLLNYL
jgi:flagellin-like hook-associated protein FlgL